MSKLDEWTNTIQCMDCLEGMKQLPDGCVDLVVTDPPYCSGAYEAKKRTKSAATTPESIKERSVIDCDSMGTLGFEWISRQWFLLSRKITKQGGHLTCFTDWRMLPQTAMLIETAGWRWNNVIVWDKGYPGLGAGFRAQHEMIILASNGSPNWKSYDYGNILKAMRLTQTRHPHEKPLEILKPIIITCTDSNDLILDPFMGSGTTAVACKQLNRRFIGFEINQKYVDIANERLKQEVFDYGTL